MNHLGNLHYAKGSRKNRKRIGRGQGSGRGGTSTRGHKGAGSRAGTKAKLGFEGGQMPLYRRIPKFGFKNHNRTEYAPINVERLEKLVAKGIVSDGVVTPDVLYASGIVASKRSLVKVLGNGEITSRLAVTAHAFSKTAIRKIEEAGGSTHTISA